MQNGGRLPNTPEANALWYYFLLASQAMREEQNQIVYEGDPDYKAPLALLFTRCAELYRANIEEMPNLWHMVDAEIDRINVNRVLGGGRPIPKLPLKYRIPRSIQ